MHANVSRCVMVLWINILQAPGCLRWNNCTFVLCNLLSSKAMFSTRFPDCLRQRSGCHMGTNCALWWHTCLLAKLDWPRWFYISFIQYLYKSQSGKLPDFLLKHFPWGTYSAISTPLHWFFFQINNTKLRYISDL